MAGGSYFKSKDAKTDPKEIFNLRLLFLLCTIAWAGMFYGFDQGNIGGIMELPSFAHSLGLENDTQEAIDNKKGSIAAMLAAGGSLGALLAAPSSDYIGRKWSLFCSCAVFIVGAVMQMFPSYDVLLTGRFIGGLGVGASSMLAPQFLSENAPRSVRGSMVCTYNLCIIASLMIAFFVNYGVSLWHNYNINNPKQWQTAMSIQLIPAGCMCLMVPFLQETPRYLMRIGRREQGLANLCKLRKLPADHPYIQLEYQETINQIDIEQEIHAGNSYLQIMKDVFTDARNFQRFFLAVMLFLFHKLTGTDSLNYFAPRIFEMIGVGDSQSLLTTGVYGLVKFVTTIYYVAYLVDRVGRRLPLIIGASIQASCMLYLALYIRFAGESAKRSDGKIPPGGVVGVVAIYLYAFGWSFGHSVACYVVAAEIFPARIRSFCMSFCFFTNWIVNYGITRSTPHMMTSMGWGVFLMYAVLTYAGVGFIWLCMPETKGRSIESMDDLFKHPLYMMWKYAYPKEEDKVRRDVQQTLFDNNGPELVKHEGMEHKMPAVHITERGK